MTADSLKAALDIDWDDDEAQRIGLNKLLDEVTSLEAWVRRRAKTESSLASRVCCLSLHTVQVRNGSRSRWGLTPEQAVQG